MAVCFPFLRNAFYCKADLLVCNDETEPSGFGIYADGHWREVQIKGDVLW